MPAEVVEARAGAWRPAAAVALLACLLYTWAPGPVTVTFDEPNWLARSDTFRQAVRDGDFDNAHAASLFIEDQTSPGVPTMWAATIGHYALRGAQEVGIVEERPPGPLTDQLRLRAGRAVVSLLCALAIGLFVWSAARLVGSRAALAAGVLLATEPFLVGHAGVLHTDALVTLWGATAIVAFAAARRRSRWHPPSLAISAVATALAVLSKVNAVPFVFGGVGVLVVFELVAALRRGEARRALRSLAVGSLAWLGIALATFVLLWPAMWVAPIQSYRQMADSLGQIGGKDTTYFRGESRTDPGPTYYPVAVLVRATPWLLGAATVAVAAAVASRVSKRSPLVSDGVGRNAPGLIPPVALLLAPLPYLVAISLASQRYDRYALPAFPFLALAGGCLVAALVSRLSDQSRRVAGVVAAVVLVALTASLAPYSISYVDPLLGEKRAEELILLGWGEGLEQMGHEIMEREADRCDRVQVLLVNAGLHMAVPCGQLISPRSFKGGRVAYAIRYVSHRQRDWFHDLYAGIERNGTLIDRVRIGGVDYCELWALGRAERRPG